MDFRFTREQEALRKEFDEFFKEEMKNAPPSWGGSIEIYTAQMKDEPSIARWLVS